MLIYMHVELLDHLEAVSDILTLLEICWNFCPAMLPSVRQSGLYVRILLRTGRVWVSEWAGPSDCRLSRLWSNLAQTDDRSALDPACWGFAVCKRWFLGHECRTETKQAPLCSYITMCESINCVYVSIFFTATNQFSWRFCALTYAKTNYGIFYSRTLSRENYFNKFKSQLESLYVSK